MKLEHFKETLIARQAELQAQLEGIHADFRLGRSADSDEQAAERENEEVLNALEDGMHKELQQIQLALGRIEHSNYFDCSHCGGPIDPKRLEALPYTTLCIQCAR
ncbi:TraR/DksA C4-type zinc finger protein [Aliiglaciecola sp. CAU 1673]|uniref:TraR/DksA family transcriptional regulator n=1 Tax=Aliiglaciecola sp. CAU 1673 TaxID=3032595 RepID=UPI0023DA9DFD|nr:TraR/DksA C4-type zinc finger protein [Aliiglaciecola sp. CAU 1673]MDF2176939.1 TraR/DksA C4-type zinc finger protein [Aliiglaciecola sp. CAU 1673]